MKDYRSPLTTLDIEDAARAHPLMYRVHAGTFSLDALPSLGLTGRPHHIVYNTSPSTESGSHWISIWLASDTTAEVMDSLGNRPTQPEVLSFLRRHASRAVFNASQIQSWTSNTCGLYCLSHGLARCRGRSFAEWLSRFSECTHENDRMMQCEFMRELALPSLFTPRLDNWNRVLSKACRRVTSV
jgi:hypothetical protein